MGIVRWTPAEYGIVRTCSIAEAMVKLPHRTMMAIKSVRKTLRVGAPFIRWTKIENRRLRKHCQEPMRKLARRFKTRTVDAVRHQKKALGLSHNPTSVPWKTPDLAMLQKLFVSSPRSDILAAFPNRTWTAIKSRAEIRGWRRPKPPAAAPNDLHGAVRTRAREDGISLGKLGLQTGCGAYFFNRRSKTVDLNKIDRAVAFFGGRLVIDWQDE
jgi:hypothetical protein